MGHAFHVGALDALAVEFGWDARTADVIIGTSAGSVVGAGLRSGLGADDMARRARGEPLSPDGAEIVRHAEAAIATAWNGRTRQHGRRRSVTVASPARLRRAVREPWRVTAGSLFSAVLPMGTVPGDHLSAPYDARFGVSWPAQPLWVVAVDLDVGRRVVFGRDDVSGVTLGRAVQASCAIPGYFEPVTIAGVRYVDGGVHSTTNADLAASADPELVVISAPMSTVSGTPELSPRYAMRQIARRWLAGEVSSLRKRGIEVVTLQPTPPDIEAMSGNSMDASKAPVVIEQVVASTLAHVRAPAINQRLAALRRSS